MRFAAFLAVAAAVASAVSLFEPEVERVQYTPTLTGFFDPESSEDAPEAIALRKLAELTGAQMHWEIESSYQTQHNKLHHVYLRQQINGVPVANCEANVNVASNGAIVSMGVSAFRGEVPVVAKTVITPEQALFRVANYAELILAKDLKPFMTEVSEGHFAFEAPSLSTEPITVDAVYIKTTEETIALAWRVHMVVDGPAQEYASYVAMVDAVDPSAELIAIQDEVKWYMPKEQAEELANNYKVLSANETDNMGMGADRAQYLVYGIPAMDPNFGERVQDQGPPDAAASPMGWFNQGNGRTFTDTRGNNVFAQDNPTGGSGWQNNYRPNCGAELDCRFPINLGLQPVTYRDASILNLFWWNNVVHDIFYLRGFDEVSGNAQENNMGRGGRENDAVQANAQDGAGFNNANMMTPADGSRGRMRMYLWNGITPMRDGDLDSGIIVHEYAHHISQRLTGGPQNVGCLSGGQPGGMGEGWGDFFATLFLQRPGTTRLQEFPMGLYAARRGIRPFPYTTSRATNPQTFGILNTGAPYNAVHAIGSVWCQILFQVYWEMRDEFGFNADWWHGESGNNALLQDVTDGLKIQPCSPNFVQARDAILTADRQNYNGRHLCALWRGFAFRGLGVGAASRSTNSVTESFEVPLECQM